MAVEAKRGCGFRKVGGLYMMGGKLAKPCCRFPIILKVCPCCGMGVRLTRTWTWIDPTPWMADPCRAGPCIASDVENFHVPSDDKVRVGLLNIGSQFYKTPERFMLEAAELGVSRRIQFVPKGFKLGEHWVLLAHPKVVKDGDGNWFGGIFAMFQPTAIEKVMTKSQHEALTEKQLKKMESMGVTPFVVPDDDPDHQGSVWDSQKVQESRQQVEMVL